MVIQRDEGREQPYAGDKLRDREIRDRNLVFMRASMPQTT
jgi:hypothetical protein